MRGWGSLLIGVLGVCLAMTGAAAYQLEQQQVSCPQPAAIQHTMLSHAVAFDFCLSRSGLDRRSV
jgi:hypothetical protein